MSPELDMASWDSTMMLFHKTCPFGVRRQNVLLRLSPKFKMKQNLYVFRLFFIQGHRNYSSFKRSIKKISFDDKEADRHDWMTPENDHTGPQCPPISQVLKFDYNLRVPVEAPKHVKS